MKLDFAPGQAARRRAWVMATATAVTSLAEGAMVLAGASGCIKNDMLYNINIIEEDVCEKVGMQSFITLVTSFILLVFA